MNIQQLREALQGALRIEGLVDEADCASPRSPTERRVIHELHDIREQLTAALASLDELETEVDGDCKWLTILAEVINSHPVYTTISPDAAGRVIAIRDRLQLLTAGEKTPTVPPPGEV